jgi:hypothetical protein
VPRLLKLISCLHGTNVTIQPNKNNMATQQNEENILNLEDSAIEKSTVDAVISIDDQNTPIANESGDFEAGPRPAHESTPLKKEHQQTSSDETILKIVVWNCNKGLTIKRSSNNRKQDEVVRLSKKYDIIALTEVDFNPDPFGNGPEFALKGLEGFKPIFPIATLNNSLNKTNQAKIRILVLVKKTLEPAIVDLMTDNFSSIWIKIGSKTLGFFYSEHEPEPRGTGAKENLLVQKAKLDRQLKEAQEAQKLDPTSEIIVAMGDANWCYQRWRRFGGEDQPLEELFGFNFHDMGITYTCRGRTSAIDHVYSRKKSDSTISIETSKRKTVLSQHHQIFVTLKTKNKVAVVTSDLAADLAAINLNLDLPAKRH